MVDFPHPETAHERYPFARLRERLKSLMIGFSKREYPNVTWEHLEGPVES